MDLIRGLHNLRPSLRGCVATIGNFDGVHLGHQAVIGQVAERAATLRLPATIVLFEPQPLEFLFPERAPARLMRLREKLLALSRYAVDRVVCLRFDERLKALTADQFVRQVLVDGLGVRHLVIGDDFRFGADREGNAAMLAEAGRAHGFSVVSMHTVASGDTRISSTRIREMLAGGDLEGAERLIGRPYRMSGRVAHGEKLGRQLGFPTANVHLHRHLVPLQGIYAVEVFGLDREPLPGAASLGHRPTVGGTKTLLEIYLLDFNEDIYGRTVHVNFLKKIRDEQRFGSLDELKAWILRDVEAVREFFLRYHPQPSPDARSDSGP